MPLWHGTNIGALYHIWESGYIRPSYCETHSTERFSPVIFVSEAERIEDIEGMGALFNVFLRIPDGLTITNRKGSYVLTLKIGASVWRNLALFRAVYPETYLYDTIPVGVCTLFLSDRVHEMVWTREFQRQSWCELAFVQWLARGRLFERQTLESFIIKKLDPFLCGSARFEIDPVEALKPICGEPIQGEQTLRR